MSIWNTLLKIINEGDNKKIAAASDDLKYWKSPGSLASGANNVSRVMSSAKDFVTDFWK